MNPSLWLLGLSLVCANLLTLPLAALANSGHEEPKKEEHGAPKEEHGAKKEEHGAPKEEHGAKKEEHGAPKEEHGAKKEEHGAPKEEHGGGHGKEEKKAERPKRTFEGIEPLFYLDEKRRPFAEPFHKREEEEFFLCRANVGEWYRAMNAEDFNILAEKNGLNKISGSTCALHLIPSKKGKKLPYLLLEFYANSDLMRECILTEECSEVRTIIMYIKDKTLYRNFIITDAHKHVHKQYCLNNKSEIIAEKACWRYFQDLAFKRLQEAENVKEEAPEEKPKRRRSSRKEE